MLWHRLGLLGGEDYQRAVDVANLTGQRDVGRSLGHGEVTALFAACAADPSPAGRRDAALLALLYGAGLRSRQFGSEMSASALSGNVANQGSRGQILPCWRGRLSACQSPTKWTTGAGTFVMAILVHPPALHTRR